MNMLGKPEIPVEKSDQVHTNPEIDEPAYFFFNRIEFLSSARASLFVRRLRRGKMIACGGRSRASLFHSRSGRSHTMGAGNIA